MHAREQIKYFLPLAVVINCLLYFTFPYLVSWVIPGTVNYDFMSPDSPGYILFAPSRTAFYPAFLAAVNFVFKTYDVVPIIQLIIYSIAVSSLCANVRLLFNKKIMSWLLFAALILNPAIFKFHLQVLTESLSVSVLCGVLAVIARYLCTGNPTNLVCAAILVATGAGIRPSNYPLIVALVILLISLWRTRKIGVQTIATSLLSIVSVLTVAASLYYVKHGEFKTQSFLGHNLYGKAIMFADESVKTTSPQSAKMMRDLFKPIRELNQTLSISPVKFKILAPAYDYSRYQALSYPEHRKLLELDTNGLYQTSEDNYLMSRAIEIIKAKPEVYASDVLLNFSALWCLWDLNTATEQAKISKIINSPQILATPYAQAIIQNQHIIPSLLLTIVRYAMIMLMAYSLAQAFLIVFIPSRLNNTQLYIAFISIAINGTYLLIALTQAGLMRYAISMWPGILILGLNLLYIPSLLKRKS